MGSALLVVFSSLPKDSLSSDVLWPLHAEFTNSSMASPSKTREPGNREFAPKEFPEGNYYLFPRVLDIVVEVWIEDTSWWIRGIEVVRLH